MVAAWGLPHGGGGDAAGDVGSDSGGGGGGGPPPASLLCGDVRVPDIYTLRVAASESGGGGGRYVQCNWRQPFEMTYLGPLLMSVEVKFDASLAVLVRDLNGNQLDHAVVSLRALGNSSGVGGGAPGARLLLGKRMRFKDQASGQVYSLGKGPQRLLSGVEVPGSFDVTAKLWGHGQVTLTNPFQLTHASWPSLPRYRRRHHNDSGEGDDYESAEAAAYRDREGSAASPSPPLTLSVRMVRYAVEFRAVDLLGQPITLSEVRQGNSQGGGERRRRRGSMAVDLDPPSAADDDDDDDDEGNDGDRWRLTLMEHSPLSVGATGSYVVRDLLSPQRNRRVLTLGSLTDGGDEKLTAQATTTALSLPHGGGGGAAGDVGSDSGGGGGGVSKVWSMSVQCGRYFLSHVVVGEEAAGGRRVSPHEFHLATGDWLQRSGSRGGGDEEEGWWENVDDEEEGGKGVRQLQPLVVTVVVALYDVVVRLWDADTHTAIPAAPKGTTVALVAVPPNQQHGANGNDGDDGDDDKGSDDDNDDLFFEGRRRRIELSVRSAGGEHSRPPTSFTDEELRALKGSYAVRCEAPGFDTTGLHVGGKNVPLLQAPTSSGHSGNGGGGVIELSAELWERATGISSGGSSSSGGRGGGRGEEDLSTNLNSGRGVNNGKAPTALFVDVQLRFNPAPVMWPHEVLQRPRLPPNNNPQPSSPSSSPSKVRGALSPSSSPPCALSIDLCLVVDATGSMEPYLGAAAEALTSASKELKLHYPGCAVRFGGVAFTDMDPDAFSPAAQHTVRTFPFHADAGKLKAWLLQHQEGGGGYGEEQWGGKLGDVPEDLLGGLDAAASSKRMRWQGTTRVCVVVSDAPCHGNRFHSNDVEDSFPHEPDPRGLTAEVVLAKFRALKVKLVFGRICKATDVMVGEFQRISSAASNAEAAQAEASAVSFGQQDGAGGGSGPAAPTTTTTMGTIGSGQRMWVDEVELPPLGGTEEEDGGGGGGDDDGGDGDKEERRLYLRDVLREALLVGSCHMEVLGSVKVSWALPAHHSRGAVKVKHFELQRKRLALPLAPLCAAEARRRRLQERERHKRFKYGRGVSASRHSTAPSGAGLYDKHVGPGLGKTPKQRPVLVPLSPPLPSSFGGHGDGGEDESLADERDKGDTKDEEEEEREEEEEEEEEEDEDGGWASTFVKGSLVRPEHSLLLPAAVPTAFRVRAHCLDGTVTDFSEQCTVLIGVPGSEAANEHTNATSSSFSSPQLQKEQESSAAASAAGVSRLLVRVGEAQIESVAFLFSNGQRRTFTSVALGAKRREKVQRSVASSRLEPHASGAEAVKAQEQAERREALVEDKGSFSVHLEPSEHVVEVRGVNGGSCCESLEFLTTHGRRKRFTCRSRDSSAGGGGERGAGKTSGFRFRAKPGRRVVGLQLKHCFHQRQQQQQQEEEGGEGEGEGAGLSEGFRVVECVYTDIPLLSDAEQEAVDKAAQAEVARHKAALEFKRSNDGSGGGGDDEEEGGGGNKKGGKEAAAQRRRAAEREAAAANEEYREALRLRAAQGAKNSSRERIKQRAASKKKSLPPGFLSLPPSESDERLPVGLSLSNNGPDGVRVSWVDFRGKEVPYFHLQREEAKNISSFSGHAWVVRSAATEEIVHMVTLTREPIQAAYIGGNKGSL